MGRYVSVCKALRIWALSLLLVTVPAIATEAAPFVYVTNYTDTVSVIDAASNTVIATIPIAAPSHIAITPDGAFAYVTTGSGISVIDTATNTVIDTIDVGGPPGDVAITPDGTLAYFSSGLVLDIATDSVVGIVPGVDNGSAIAITPDGAAAYITALGQHAACGNQGNPVIVVDTTSNTVATCILYIGRVPTSVAMTPDGAFGWVGVFVSGCRASSYVSVLDLSTNTEVARVDTSISTAVRIAITPDGAFAYVLVVANPSCPAFPGGGVSVIDTSSKKVLTEIGMRPLFPRGIAITPDGTFAYVALTDGPNGPNLTAAVINLSTNTVVATVPLGGGTSGDVAITPF